MTLEQIAERLTRREELTRVTLVGPIEEHTDAIHCLSDNGYNITRSGAYTDSTIFPSVDSTRYKITAEIVTRENAT